MGRDVKTRRAADWFAASVLALLLTAVTGAALYPGMPDPVPVHWDGSGSPDRFAPKTAWTVFAPLLTGLGCVAFLWLLHRFLPALSRSLGTAGARDIGAGKDVVAQLAPALTALIGWLSIRGWLGWDGAASIWIPTVLFMFIGIGLVFRAVSAAAALLPHPGPRSK
ncbi:DUF1648 domain-containing protein [Pseudarthrobacter sp. NPDC058119]|uniref:DUF1648 domain-containing protein n=1 Tax=Pseudarthrobacter sp. NPDC058119 TaxID=3346348 RepID=UPI0036DA1D33